MLRTSIGRRRGVATVTAGGLDAERTESFLGPIRRDKRITGDLVAALAGCRPRLMLDAAGTLPRFDRPVLLVWGEACEFFPMTLAQRLAFRLPTREAGLPREAGRPMVGFSEWCARRGAARTFTPREDS
jgi:hypothetical protein